MESFISPRSEIGIGVLLQSNVSIGMLPEKGKVIIGAGGLVRSGSVIYSDVIIGEKFKTGHNVLIREKTIIGDNVTIGTNAVVDGNCKIGNNVSIQSAVYITVNTVIEDGVFIGPGVITTNDKYMKNPQTEGRAELIGPVIKKNAKIGAGTIILPGVVIGENAVIGAGSIITKDVPSNSIYISRQSPLVK